MQKKRLMCLLLMFAVLLGLLFTTSAETEPQEITILFTHDLHSHLLSAVDESGNSYGGFARLKTLVDEYRKEYPDAVFVDAGDFSMGTLYQTVYSEHALELRSLGALGCDVTTLGNHEYDYRPAGLAKMLNSAVASGDKLPELVLANYRPPLKGEDGYNEDIQAVTDALANYGAEEKYTVIERGGVNFAFFGIFGIDAHACAPMSGMVLEDAVENAEEIVALIEQEVAEPRVVVCLSHSGTVDETKKSEDEQLAMKVDGIDVIISGHTHTTLNSPKIANGTYIVSCGEYGKNLGMLRLDISSGDNELLEYELISVDSSVEEDKDFSEMIAGYDELVADGYLSKFGDLAPDTVIAHNPYEFDSLDELGTEHRESALGNLLADSYVEAIKDAEGEDYIPIDFAVTATGIIRSSLPVGDITVENVYNISSLGIGKDGLAGYPLVAVWLTGKEIKAAFEVDASVTALMPAAQLFFSGMEFTFNPNRMIFNKVTDSAQVLPDGTKLPIEDDKLYRVAGGLYCIQMLDAVKDKSFGILSITPRDADGDPIANAEDFIVQDSNGMEVKEWYALASYLMELGTVPEKYSGPIGRKIIDDSRNPIDLIKNPNWITIAVIVIVLAVLTGLLFAARGITKRIKKKKGVQYEKTSCSS